MGATHTFYADEAGHAGINYLDAQQPFHIAGGFLVPEQHEQSFAEQFNQIRSGSAELKGGTLTKSTSGQRRAATAIRSLRKAGAVPFFWAMQRSYCIAGKVVDVFLDTAYYPECAWLALADVDQREEVTQTIVTSVPPGVLEAFATAYRKPQRDAWAAVLDGIADAMRTAGEAKLEATFRGARKALDVVIEAEDLGNAHTELAALNVPALMHALRLVDRYVEFIGGMYRVIHDVNVQFEEPFRSTISSHQVGPDEPCEILLPNGRRHRQFLRRMTTLEFANSKAVLGLQAADLLVSSVGRVTKKIPTPPEVWPVELQQLALEVLPPIMDEVSAFAGMYAQLDTKARLVIGMMSGRAGTASSA
jgi:hypothetical protein